MYAPASPAHDTFSRASARGMTLLARHARAFQAAATDSAATGPVVGAHHSNSRSNIWRVTNG